MKHTLVIIAFFSINLIQAQKQLQTLKIKSAGEKTIIHQLQLESEILKESRDVYISLPPNYDKNIQSYPVVFVLDGEFLFDVTRSMTTLWAARNYMPESIVIGLPNMSNEKRFDLALKVKGANGNVYYHGGGDPKKYLRFFEKELFPMLAKKYRLAKNRTLIGLSPTSGTVYQAFFSGSNFFQAFIAMNGGITSFLAPNKTIGDGLIASLDKHDNTVLYLGAGAQSDPKREKVRLLGQQQFLQSVQEKKQKGTKIVSERHKNESGYGVVIPALTNAFKTIYPRDEWLLDYWNVMDSKNPALALKAYYAELSTQYGFQIYPLESGFNTISNLYHAARILLRNKKVTAAKEFIRQGLVYYPNSDKLYFRLSQAYQQDQQLKEAVQYLKKAITLAKKYQQKETSFYRNELQKLMLLQKK